MVELGEPAEDTVDALARKLDEVQLKRQAASATLARMQGGKLGLVSTKPGKAQTSRLETDMIHKQAGLASTHVIISAIRSCP